MNTPSIAHLDCTGKAPGIAGLLPPMRPKARTSMPILLRNGWLGPLVEGNLDAPFDRRTGPQDMRLTAFSGFGGLDWGRAKALIEESFGKALVDGYEAMPVSRVYLAGDYEGIAVMRRLWGHDYLDKLAVSPRVRGSGVGRMLWENIKNDFPSLIWRAAPGNPANEWYGRSSDGTLNAGRWLVHWYGIDAMTASALAPLVASLPPTLVNGNNGLKVNA